MTDFRSRYGSTVTDHDVDLNLPIFVFGTLRPGNGNSRTYEGLAEAIFDGEAVLRDHRLVTNGAFPYCLPAEGEATTGCLIRPSLVNYRQALQNMDMLEGVPSHYNRKPCMIEVPDAIVQAWYYCPDDWRYYTEHDAVPNNDWSDRERRSMRRPSQGITDWFDEQEG